MACSTSIETFRGTLAELGVEVRLVAPRYADEADEPGIVRVCGRPVPGDPEDRLVGWRAMHREVMAAAGDCDLIHVTHPIRRPLRRPQGGAQAGLAGTGNLSHAVRGIPAALCRVPSGRLAQGPGARLFAASVQRAGCSGGAVEGDARAPGILWRDHPAARAANRHSDDPVRPRRRAGLPRQAWYSAGAAGSAVRRAGGA